MQYLCCCKVSRNTEYILNVAFPLQHEEVVVVKVMSVGSIPTTKPVWTSARTLRRAD